MPNLCVEINSPAKRNHRGGSRLTGERRVNRLFEANRGSGTGGVQNLGSSLSNEVDPPAALERLLIHTA